jgi:hypothetical protein
MKYEQPEERYDTYTSPAMIELAELMPDFMPEGARSPKRLEHLSKAYAATLAEYVTGAVDWGLRKSGKYPAPVGSAVADVPVADKLVKRFLPDDKLSSSKYVQQFYDTYDLIQMVGKKIDAQADDARGLLRIQTAHAREINNTDQVKAAYKTIKDINEQMRMIQNDPSMTRVQKNTQMEPLMKQKNDAARLSVMQYKNSPKLKVSISSIMGD